MTLRSSAPRAPLAVTGCCLAMLASIATPALAQTRLEPIVITGSREPQALDRVTADVVVIDAERIRASTADSIEDLLRREAGVQVSRNGGPGQNASIFIRGGGANTTVVLIDGVRVGSATLGQVEFESIGLAQIDHIEILRGPASSLYGADAVGGVVQIFTKRGEGEPRFSANEKSRLASMVPPVCCTNPMSTIFKTSLSVASHAVRLVVALLPPFVPMAPFKLMAVPVNPLALCMI